MDYSVSPLSAERQEAEPSSVNAQQTATPSSLRMGVLRVEMTALATHSIRHLRQSTNYRGGWGWVWGELQSSC